MVNGLFTVTGVGLIPWRVRDTYRMIRIAHYQHLTWRLRKQRGLPALSDRNDLPDGVRESKELNGAAEDDARYDQEYVLSPRQAAKLAQLQHDFAASQSWYRPHETSTHRAFPISFALAITFFNDGNSLFQCMLCGVMWGFAGFTNEKYKQRPAWTTGCLIPFSFLCGIVAGVLIWRGGERTKKKEEVEQRLLDALEIDAEELGSASLELLPEPKAEGAEGAEGNEVEGLATPVRPRGFDAGANDQPSSALGEEISNEQVHPLQQER